LLDVEVRGVGDQFDAIYYTPVAAGELAKTTSPEEVGRATGGWIAT
jgi:hypothetical protein